MLLSFAQFEREVTRERIRDKIAASKKRFIVHKGKACLGEHEAIVDEKLWNEVQALLAENACGSSRRLKHQHPSLLTGKVIDGVGRPMSPTHANKSRRRYRYYVTRSDRLDGARAWRVSAHDLEQLVCSQIAETLLDRQFVWWVARERTLDAEQLQAAAVVVDMTAAILRSGSAHAKAELLALLVEQVHLFEDRIEVKLDDEAARTQLCINAELHLLAEPTIVTIPAVRVRRGHQLRLVVPGR
jgi:hypothetical protein